MNPAFPEDRMPFVALGKSDLVNTSPEETSIELSPQTMLGAEDSSTFEASSDLAVQQNEVVSDSVPTSVSYRERASNIKSAVGHDMSEKDAKGKLKSISVGAVGVGAQVLDRARLAVILVPRVAIHVLEHTHEAPLTGLAAAGTFFAWSALVGSTFEEGIEQFPETNEAVAEAFPGAISAISDALPGIDEKERRQVDNGQSLVKTIGKTVLTRARRGASVVGIGPTAYVGISRLKGKSRSEIHKFNLSIDADGGAVIGVVAGGVAETIIKISNDHPALAERIQNDTGSAKLWYGIAAGLLATEFISNRLKQRKTKNVENMESIELT